MNHPNTTARILSLDLATVCGHATLANGIITSGSQNFTRYAGSKKRPKDHAGAPFAMFRRWLAAKIIEDKPTAIAYEEVMRWGGASAAHCFGGFRGIMLEQATIHGLPCFGYAVGSIKIAWTGKGNADKDAMMKETLRRFPALDLTDSNEADAIAILYLHLSQRVAA